MPKGDSRQRRHYRLGRPEAQDHARRLTLADALEIEQRADEVIGVHVRRLGYAEILPRFPHLVKPALFRNASSAHRLVGNMMWPVTRQFMMRMYDIRPGPHPRAGRRWKPSLTGLMASSAGRPYLAGEHFSRADLTVASLLSSFARPKEMPVFHDMVIPDSLAADVERWRERPVMRWVVSQYRTHRAPRNKGAELAAATPFDSSQRLDDLARCKQRDGDARSDADAYCGAPVDFTAFGSTRQRSRR